PLELDVGVLRLERCVELRHLRGLAAADLLVPDGQRDVAERGGIGAHRGGRGRRSSGRLVRPGRTGRESERGPEHGREHGDTGTTATHPADPFVSGNPRLSTLLADHPGRPYFRRSPPRRREAT